MQNISINVSNFSEFHPNYESSSHILFFENWFWPIALKTAVIWTISCCILHFVFFYQHIVSKPTIWVTHLFCFVRWLWKWLSSKDYSIRSRWLWKGLSFNNYSIRSRFSAVCIGHFISFLSLKELPIWSSCFKRF